ncbi:MAG: alkaline phosphatase family protein [Chloroflexi bacterium]|nr:alkaline phosphatase family protein [Chloroflexota bacterium]
MSTTPTTPPAAPVRPGVLHRIANIWADEYDTAMNWPNGRRHLLGRAVVITLVDAAALVVAGWLVPGVVVESLLGALLVTIIAGLLTFALRPVAFLILPQSILTTALLTVLFLVGTLLIAQRLIPSVTIDGIIAAVITALIIALVNAIALAILGLDEDESFYRRSMRKLARARGDVDDRPGPGFAILQVDGLSEPVIKNALRTGRMPFLSSWLREGSHKLGRYEALAPSMTTAGQTGILHGDNSGIPAFRWWERDRRYLMVSNHPEDAFLIEQRASGPNDLLRDGGASISNMVSGGAPRCVATNSQLSKQGQGIRMDAFSLYLINPYNITRGAVTFCQSLIVEYFQARKQRTRGVVPRITRGMPFPFLRAATTTLLRDMTVDLMIGEMYRGTPIIFADYLGYDEVAHHAGPERPESMDQLEVVDRMVRSLARAAEEAPRTYHFILLSDHGQTQGATFDERYGVSLEGLVRRLMTGEVDSLAATGDAESWGPVNAFFTEVVRVPGRTARLARRALADETTGDVVSLGPSGKGERSGAGAGTDSVPDLVIAASGNLANIYFPDVPERRSLEDIEALHPDLVRGLVEHPGIGFVLVRSERFGALAIGRQGIHYLADDRVVGDDPLTIFGPHAADNLRRLDSYTHVGDILVNSIYDPSTDEIAPFEHQVGAHGGFGGPQNQAFLLYPTALETETEPIALVGAEAVNTRIHQWIARARALETDGATAAPPDTAVRSEVAEVLQDAKRSG